MDVTISFDAADELFNLLRAYDSALDLGYPDKASKAFRELQSELERCRKEKEAAKGGREMIAREYEDGNIESIEISAAGDSGCAIVVLHISKEYGNSGSEFSINQAMTAREARILAGWLEKAADEAEQEQEDRIAEDAEFNRIKPLGE